MIWLFLILSIILNGFFVWYIFNILKLNSLIFENVRLIKERIVFFNNHVSKIYAMETYYGDETIKSMVEHSKELISNMDEFLDTMETGADEKTDE
jgi:hypothetical protein